MSRLSDRTARRTATVRRNVKLAAGASGRARLSVFRSAKHIYAQVIDDAKGATLAAASSLEKTMREGAKTGANIEAAKAVGKLIAERAQGKGRQGGRVRPRRLSLSRARQGAGRRRPRRRPQLLTDRIDEHGT